MLAVKDWKVWWLALALAAQVLGLSFNSYFPSKLQNFTSLSELLFADWIDSTYKGSWI
jgi:hypothetical protein